ncbi:MAG: hypothetical protein AAGC55_19390, partial [Myxococcota bacterium]
MSVLSKRLLLSSLLVVPLLIGACGDDGDDDGTTDGGGTTDDAATDDAATDAPPAGDNIGIARGEADGAVDVQINEVLVTYIKPETPTDPAGFFVQIAQEGPALFIAVDPATTTPAVQVGDNVSFRITEMATANDLRQANTIADVEVNSSGNDLSGLVQDITATTDVVSALGDYESELISVRATVAEDFGSAGGGHVSAQID